MIPPTESVKETPSAKEMGQQSLICLYLEVSESVAKDVQMKMEAWVAEARADALEESAKIADHEIEKFGEHTFSGRTAKKIAAAIRAAKDKQP